MIKSWSRHSSPYSPVVFQTGFIAGDPTILGWTTFAFYLVVAFLCFRNKTRKLEASDSRPANSAWGWHALAYLLLGLNKQLDLQTSINALGRQLTGTIGWYGNRPRASAVLLRNSLRRDRGLSVEKRPWREPLHA